MTAPAPYKFCRMKNIGGGYSVRATTYAVGSIRPSRNAAGMTFTASRSGRSLAYPIASRLAISGTLDKLSGGIHRFVRAKPCQCCGSRSKGKYELNDSGRLRLHSLRKSRQHG